MKRTAALVLLLTLTGFVACGGSSGGGGGTAGEQAEASANDFYALMQGCGYLSILGVGSDLAAGAQKQSLPPCTCPGDGTITPSVDESGNLVLTFDNCKTSDGGNFLGTATLDAVSGTGSIDMTDFGAECSTLTGQAVSFTEGACGGSVTATCEAGTSTCTLIEPATSGEGCDATCT